MIEKHIELSDNTLLNVKGVHIGYGEHVVVQGVDLTLAQGEIGCLLGPSGCGKSTLLRAIAGLEPLLGGKVAVADRVLSDDSSMVAAEQRNIGMVFQDIALFPHLTIADNIAFGLRGQSAVAKAERVRELLSLIGLPGIEQRYPHSLSGGQQQRVALARALAPMPKLLLMDEPFSGLDATLKEELIPEIRRILYVENIAALIVTHDQLEAFALADKVALMRNGNIEQTDTAYEMYHEPKTRFVADFIGQGFFIPAEVLNPNQINTDLGVLNLESPTEYTAQDRVDLLIRPDDVLHDDDSNYLGLITSKQFKGTYFQYQVELTNGQRLLCIASSHHNHALGQRIGIRLDLDHTILFKRPA